MPESPAALDIRSIDQRAHSALAANRAGGSTAPTDGSDWFRSTWDSAFVALGLRHTDPDAAAEELRHSFDGQWSNGLLPHLTFAQTSDSHPAAGTYRTNPAFWRSELAEFAPDWPTSGIGSPPIQATIALRISEALGRPAKRFLLDMYPRLAAWHSYILSARIRHDIPLAEAWHPWETSRANSTAWDEPLRFVDVSDVAGLRSESDVEIEASWFNDRSLSIVDQMRRDGYPAGAFRRTSPFAVHDIVFNALLAKSATDLATIAERIGQPADRHRETGKRVALYLDRLLYDRENSWYISRDVRTGKPLAALSAGHLVPLFAGIPRAERAKLLVQRWRSVAAPEGARTRGLVGTAHPSEPLYEAAGQHRGPIQMVANWMLMRGLESYGYTNEAEMVRTAIFRVVDAQGFRSRYGFDDGTGHGQHGHSATAGVVLDLLAE